MKPNRLARIGLLLLTVAIAFAGAVASVQAQNKQPNVVIMLADNMGFGDLGSYGSGGEMRGMPTPRLDRLASEGLRLTQFLVEPGCTPSRAGLLLGRYSPRAGLGSIINAGSPSTLQGSEVTLAELFKSKGYATAIVGKWHLGGEKQSLPTYQGFDEYHVGILETTDGTLYAENMKRLHMPQAAIDAAQPWIWESQPGTKDLRKVQPYDLAYRAKIEGDIAASSVDYIKKQTAAKQPFFLYVGWSHVHYPPLPSPEFQGKSRIGDYGDVVMELDHRSGQVLDALKEAGVEDNTIVIWLSDNGPVRLGASGESFMGGSAGPFRGEVGDALEGSLRVPGMIKWPGHIKPRVSNEMVSIHDFFPTLANIIGAKMPKDRPIDGQDQTAFFTGLTDKSARESLITFIGDEIVAVRWRNYRIYPKEFVPSAGNPSKAGVASYRMELAMGPALFDIERDPREEWNLIGVRAWVLREYMKVVGQYQESLKKYPNPPAISMTEFKR